MNNNTDGHIIKPPKEVLAGKHVLDSAIIANGQKYFIYEKTEYPPEGGIYVYYKGKPFPVKGFPFPEAVYANDNLKRVTRFLITIVSGKQMILPILTFAILPWKWKLKKIEHIMDEYTRIAIWQQNQSYLLPERYCYAAKEIGGFVYEFCIGLGVQKHLCNAEFWKQDRVTAEPVWATIKNPPAGFVWAFARAIATIFEYDDAYRYRVQDIGSAVNKEEIIRHPRKELLRLLAIYSKREKSHASEMVKKFSSIVSLLLMHPKIKKAFIEAVKTVDFSRLGLDNADRYNVLVRDDYDFIGYSFRDRARMYSEIHMLSKCHKAEVKLSKDAAGNTVGGKCTKCWKELDPKDVEFDYPPMLEITDQ